MTMSYVKCCCILGNGDFSTGRELLFAIARRVQHARAEHPWPEDAEDMAAAAKVVQEEALELVQAAEEEGPERVVEEALDTIAPSIRVLNKEWQHGTAHR